MVPEVAPERFKKFIIIHNLHLAKYKCYHTINSTLNKFNCPKLEKRKETILAAIEEQGKLTPQLKKQIEQTYNSTELEDLYLPYKKKRKTRASVAKEKGLEPLAQVLFMQKNNDVKGLASSFINKDVANTEEALQGARDIIAEWVNEDQDARNKVRFAFKKGATIRSKVARGKKEEGSKYQDYFDFGSQSRDGQHGPQCAFA